MKLYFGYRDTEIYKIFIYAFSASSASSFIVVKSPFSTIKETTTPITKDQKAEPISRSVMLDIPTTKAANAPTLK